MHNHVGVAANGRGEVRVQGGRKAVVEEFWLGQVAARKVYSLRRRIDPNDLVSCDTTLRDANTRDGIPASCNASP